MHLALNNRVNLLIAYLISDFYLTRLLCALMDVATQEPASFDIKPWHSERTISYFATP